MVKLDNDEMYNIAWLKAKEGKTKSFEKYLATLKKRNKISTGDKKKCANELNMYDNVYDNISINDKYPYEENQQILQTLMLLNEEDRLIFYLNTWQDYSMRDLQKELNLTYDTIRYRLSRAKRYLKDNYNDKVRPIWRN